MRTAAIVQARMGSKRLPGKVLRTITGKTILEHITDRLRRVVGLDEVIFATAPGQANRAIIEEAQRLGVLWSVGNEQDCLQRFKIAVKQHDIDHFVRVTADNPLICPDNITDMLAIHLEHGAEFTYTLHMPEGCGLGMVVMSREALFRADAEAVDPYHREYIDEYPLSFPEKFRTSILQAPASLRRPYRLTVDEPDDLRMMTHIYEALYDKNGYIPLEAALIWLDAHPQIAAINSHVVQET
ncbi:cytidylyltransferase domain-containing protein [uncultured Desulfobacter sp.]|uniref:cytidylyltransferase domain-containing protein n=1 Tax=uncultured Desulfobacter sp. TaxID=240139 RepID=UPI0029F58ED6|nr:NTP transferase domain-containing protein [uncultured Desulfobacter sp.]